MTYRHLIALGANAAGSLPANARMAARAAMTLAHLFDGGVTASPLYATPAWPPGSGPDFVNAAVTVDAPIGPRAMLALLHRIERRAGRTRRVRWGPRSLDLDLIATGSLVRPDRATQGFWRRLGTERQSRDAPDTLILPHPRLQDRPFVLIPLAQIAPRWRHPITGRTVAAMAAELAGPSRLEVRQLHGYLSAGLVKSSFPR